MVKKTGEKDDGLVQQQFEDWCRKNLGETHPAAGAIAWAAAVFCGQLVSADDVHVIVLGLPKTRSTTVLHSEKRASTPFASFWNA